MQIVNCHIHTFTHEHVPSRFVRPPLSWALRIRVFRKALAWLVRLTDRGRRGRIARYAEILETSYNRTQEDVFKIVRGFYAQGTRFVVLPMDMAGMNAGRVARGIEEQHDELAQLRRAYPEIVIPFAAVDARRDGFLEQTTRLLESGFRGLKLYPPLGYHPADRRLLPLYEYAERHDVPVLTHCSRPAAVAYRGEPTEEMRVDPATGGRLDLGRHELLTLFTDPHTYRPLLEAYPRLRICLAHFGGAGDWNRYLEHPWGVDATTTSWLTKIADMLRSGDYPNLWTDVSYTVFADDEYVYLLKVLLTDPRIRSRVLFGSDFYVVADAKLEERRRAVRVRAVLGEDVFAEIAEANPRIFLGERGNDAPD